jgi:hypothetical protein
MIDPINRLKTGQRLPNFSLPDLRNKPVSLSSYRRRSNLVVLFSGEPVPFAFTICWMNWLKDMMGWTNMKAEALAVLPCPMLKLILSGRLDVIHFQF